MKKIILLSLVFVFCKSSLGLAESFYEVYSKLHPEDTYKPDLYTETYFGLQYHDMSKEKMSPKDIESTMLFLHQKCPPELKMPPLVCAAWGKGASAIRELLKKGEDINQTDALGRTASMIASHYRDDLNVIRELAQEEVRKNGKISASTLVFAIYPTRSHQPDREKLNMLLNMGADVNGRTSFGFTPLMVAAAWESKTVEALTKEQGGKAAENLFKYDGAVEALVKHGADVNMRINVKDYLHLYGDDSSILREENKNYFQGIFPASYALESAIRYGGIEKISAISIPFINSTDVSYSIVKYLYSKGATVEKDEFGTVLCYSRFEENEMNEMCDILEKKGITTLR